MNLNLVEAVGNRQTWETLEEPVNRRDGGSLYNKIQPDRMLYLGKL